MLVTGAGLAVGVGAALGTMRLMTAVLFGVSPFDPATYAAVIAGLGTVALFATWLPARQATSVDPSSSLRGE
jgi:ABC-type antimicrobial peptide transport system permease subunit